MKSILVVYRPHWHYFYISIQSLVAVTTKHNIIDLKCTGNETLFWTVLIMMSLTLSVDANTFCECEC